MSSTLVTVKGFAPTGLIPRLKEAPWTRGYSKGEGEFENFDVLKLGGYCLAKPPDRLAPYHFAVVVIDGKTGERFEVEGFGFRDLPTAMEQGPPVWKENSILGHVLKRVATVSPGERRLVEYTIELRAA